MDLNYIKKIINTQSNDIAFVIGNGINRHNEGPSWDDLLMNLWKEATGEKLEKLHTGISVTEFYDIMDLVNTKEINLQQEVAKSMSEWKPKSHHENIIKKIHELNAPLLTTNFDETLSKTCNFKLYKTEKEGFTDYYPWGIYYGDSQLQSPLDGFGIWHINGMIKYHRSIKLGLNHYMGSVQRSKNMISKDKTTNLYSSQDNKNWAGSKTWLDLIFHKSLFIFGLGLEENETFLRWLLIERTKYFKKYKKQEKQGWYITTKEDSCTKEGKKFFLERVGIEVIEVDSYKNIYEDIWVP